MNKLHIVLSSNERYMPGATVALAGVALNAKPVIKNIGCVLVITKRRRDWRGLVID